MVERQGGERLGQPKYFQMYLDSEDVLQDLSDEELGKLLRLLFRFANNLELETGIQNPAIRTAYRFMAAQIKREMEKYEGKCKKNAENGKKGGRPKTGAAKEATKEAEKGTEKGTEKEKPIRHKYGEYSNVLLSDTDMQKLQDEFPNDWQQRIERLSEYMASTGKTYKNHLATIRNWARNDAERVQQRQEQEPPPYYCGEAPEGFYDCDM